MGYDDRADNMMLNLEVFLYRKVKSKNIPFFNITLKSTHNDDDKFNGDFYILPRSVRGNNDNVVIEVYFLPVRSIANKYINWFYYDNDVVKFVTDPFLLYIMEMKNNEVRHYDFEQTLLFDINEEVQSYIDGVLNNEIKGFYENDGVSDYMDIIPKPFLI